MSEYPTQQPPKDGVVHVYDGIEEQDNLLPRWWLFTLYGAIAFAAAYWVGYEVLQVWPGTRGSYEAEVVLAQKEEAKRLLASGPVTNETLIGLSQNPDMVSKGAQVYAANCVACHRADGGGNIGPNLTDNFWIHGSKPTAIATRIREGVLEKGMPAWSAMLGEERVIAVTAYVLTLKGKKVEGGKAPQGTEEENGRAL